MAIDFLYPQYEVVRNNDRCINCRACERQCANEVHFWDADNNRMHLTFWSPVSSLILR